MLIFSVCILFTSINSTYAQVNTTSLNTKNVDTSSTSIWQDFNIGLNTGSKILSAPAHFEASDWIYGGVALAATGVTLLADNSIRDNLKRNHSRFLDGVGDVGYDYGNANYAIAFSGAIYLGGKIFKDEKFTTTGRMLLESLLYAGITTTVLKVAIGRSRPYTNDGPYRFNGFQLKTETTSMPSGHVTVAFAVSSVLAERFDNPFASVLIYTLAASTVFQRMYSDHHWASDCIPAAVIGYTIGKAVVRFDNDFSKRINVSAGYMPGGLGLNLSYSLR